MHRPTQVNNILSGEKDCLNWMLTYNYSVAGLVICVCHKDCPKTILNQFNYFLVLISKRGGTTSAKLRKVYAKVYARKYRQAQYNLAQNA